ncbi:MAG: phenylalanine--tRNA ligase subunit alpha [bacterium]|nr:phenylalanine--tRNA ligase subunit alpha [bacterium]
MPGIDLKSLKNKAEKEIVAAKTVADLDQLFSKYLGSKGEVKKLFKGIKILPETERKRLGGDINNLQKGIIGLMESKKGTLGVGHLQDAMKAEAETLGYELPKIGHLHPITQTIRMLNKIFIEMGYSVVDGPEIETDEYNFRRLNVPKDHPAMDMQDTIYIQEPDFLLRTHTSSVETRTMANFKPPMKFVCPGRVYRNEKVNKSNHFIFHHYQGVAILNRVSLKDLFGTFSLLFKKMYGPRVVVRYRNKYYPEVEPGVGLDILCFNCQGKGCSLCKNVGWIEMGGAGIIHPNVMKMAGIDSKKWMGFAFGLGLDRWVMAKYKISDIRTLLGGNLAYKYHEGENALNN